MVEEITPTGTMLPDAAQTSAFEDDGEVESVGPSITEFAVTAMSTQVAAPASMTTVARPVAELPAAAMPQSIGLGGAGCQVAC